MRLFTSALLAGSLAFSASSFASEPAELHSFEELIAVTERLVGPAALGYLAASIQRLADQDPDSARGRRFALLSRQVKKVYDELTSVEPPARGALPLVFAVYQKLLSIDRSCARSLVAESPPIDPDK